MKHAYSKSISFAAMLILSLVPSAADCQELFGGLFAHDVAITRSQTIERGEDLELGVRLDPILPSLGKPRPQLAVLANSAGGANFASAGLSWKLGRRIYLRPSVGIAVHTGDVHVTPTFLARHRIPFGSAVLFAPAIAAGVRISDRISLEAAWLHFSNAGLFSNTNPGIDDVGLALSLRF